MRPLIRLLLLCLTILLTTSPRGAVAPAASSPRSVIVFLPDDPTTPAMAAVAAGLKAAVQAGWPGLLTFHFESLDASWFSSPQYHERLRELYRLKYRGYRPDAIVALRSDVVGILLAVHRDLWPGVPLVFVAEDQRDLARLPRAPDLSGVWLDWEVHRTLELALQLLPRTRRVALLMGGSSWERSLYPAVDEALARFAGRLAIIDLRGLPLAELERRLAALPNDAIVFLHTLMADGEGRGIVGLELFRRLRANLHRPVFTVHGQALGHGIVGGAMVSYDRLGRDLGGMVLGWLRGAPPQPAVRAADVGELAFDARELARFRIPAARLPRSAAVLFREPSLWIRYRWQASVVLAVGALQAVLITMLLIEQQRRARAQAQAQRAELEARRMLSELAHLNRVAVAGQLGSSFAHELNQPLAAILNNARAARRLLDGPAPDVTEAQAALDDIAADDKRAAEVIQRMRGLLRRSEVRRERHDLSELARAVVRLLENDARLRGAALVLEPAPGPLPVRGDATLLQQVALNLITNALDAVAAVPQPRRRVTVRTARDGQRVTLLVEDSGRGSAEPDLERLFQPFFTTKPDGLGLGLSICRSIIEAHGGRLWAAPAPEGGLVMSCALPGDSKEERE